MKKQYNTINILKLICALLVVFIHSYEVSQGNIIAETISKCFTSQAVPFFFIVSGFFFGKKLFHLDDKMKFCKEYFKKMIILYGVWGILWLPYYFYIYYIKYGISLYSIFVIIRRYIFAGQGVYWYILVLAESALICGYLISKNKEKLLLVFSVIFFIMGLSYDINLIHTPIDTIFYQIFSWSNNVIMKGIPYFYLGIFLSKKDLKFNNALIIILYVLVSIINIGIYVKLKNPTLELLYPIQATLLFLFGVNFNIQTDTRYFRELSNALFYLHTIFIYFFIDIFFQLTLNNFIRWVSAVLLSSILYLIIKKTNLKPLKYLISVK